MSRTEDLGRLREEIQAGHRDRAEFVTNLTRTVAGLRKGFMDENRAAHAAWRGPARAQVTEPTERTARVEPGAGEKVDRPGFEAAQRASEEAEATAMKKGGEPTRKGMIARRMREAVSTAMKKGGKPTRKGRGR